NKVADRFIGSLKIVNGYYAGVKRCIISIDKDKRDIPVYDLAVVVELLGFHGMRNENTIYLGLKQNVNILDFIFNLVIGLKNNDIIPDVFDHFFNPPNNSRKENLVGLRHHHPSQITGSLHEGRRYLILMIVELFSCFSNSQFCGITYLRMVIQRF